MLSSLLTWTGVVRVQVLVRGYRIIAVGGIGVRAFGFFVRSGLLLLWCVFVAVAGFRIRIPFSSLCVLFFLSAFLIFRLAGFFVLLFVGARLLGLLLASSFFPVRVRAAG